MRRSKLLTVMILCFTLGILVGSIVFVLTHVPAAADIEVINDRDYAPAVYRELTSADESIHIAMFSLTYYLKYPRSSVNQFIKALVEKHDVGVDVRVIIDEYPEDHEAGLLYLSEHGVPIQYDGKDRTTHAKLIIIDGKKVILGSSNWRYYSVDQNHEANVLIESSEVAQQYETYFEELWNNQA